MDKLTASGNRLLTEYVSFNELKNMNDDDILLVSRIEIRNKLAMLCLTKNYNTDLYYKVAELNYRLNEKDEERNRPVFGIELSVKEINEIFSREDLRSTTSLMLPRNNIKTNENIITI